jgi:cell wall-associated NlpC family hydrolase
MSRIAAVAAALALFALAPLASASTGAGPVPPSWAQAQIKVVTAQGLMGGDPAGFRPDDPLTAGDLADLVAGLTGKPAAVPANPAAPVTMAGLDAALVRGLGLGDAARLFMLGTRAAGLAPPARFGTEAVARLLGFRYDHPRSEESLELAPSQPATRAEAAYSAAKILNENGWEIPWVRQQAQTFVLPVVSGWQQKVLQTAVSLIGYPYVWGGTSEQPQAPLGVDVPGGFDCSGFVWRVYKLGQYAAGTSLAETLRGRTTYAMSGEVPRRQRLGEEDLQPADVLFFGAHGPNSKPVEVDHTGIYLGNGWFIHSGGEGVYLSSLATPWWASQFAWARRPLAEAGLTP